MASRFKSFTIVAAALTIALGGVAAGAEAENEAAASTDGAFVPPAPGTPLFEWTDQQRIVGFRSFEGRAHTRSIDNGGDFLPLTSAPADFSGVTYDMDGEAHTIDGFMEQFMVTGLLVAKGQSILLERYRLGHSAESNWISFSVAKSLTSLLIGAAIKDGYIASVDDPITDYLPRLKGTAYNDTTIRNLLHMSSGVDWNEDFDDPESDVGRAGSLNGIALYRYLAQLGTAAKPGEKFNYSTGETNLAGGLLRAAIGNNASSYLAAKIWGPFMEDAASWSLSSDVELGGCCVHATLRDYARIGMFALRDGELPDGTKTLPDGWMKASTTPSPAFPGYGYLWWLMGGGAYAALGIHGQLVFVDPATEVVISAHTALPRAIVPAHTRHQNALIAALREHAVSL